MIPRAVSGWREGWLRLEAVADRLHLSWVNRGAFAGLTWLQVIATAAVLVLTALVSELLHWRMQRKSKEVAGAAHRDPTSAVPERSWLALLLQQAHPALRLLIWIWGLTLGGHLLLVHLPFDDRFALAVLTWFRRVGQIAACFWLLYRLVSVLELELLHWAASAQAQWVNILAAVAARALRLVVLLLGVLLLIPSLGLPPSAHALVQLTSSLILIGFIGFIGAQLVLTAERGVISSYRVDIKDNLATRKIQTQVRILTRVAVILIGLVTLALMLMVFEPVRALGKSILASAGVAGIVVGIAAQRTLATLLAGVQIAFTQPIRLDDVVIVEGEWGRIEEITMTYVVVAIWDLRRMILPITYFVEKPFQNWTRVSANLLGSVFLYMDYTVPIAPLRAELDRILEGSPLWDRKVKVLQVTDAKEQTVEIRILASSADSSISWDLRCLIREQMVDFLQRHYPASLPRSRPMVELATAPAPPHAANPPPRAPSSPVAGDAVSSSLGLHPSATDGEPRPARALPD